MRDGLIAGCIALVAGIFIGLWRRQVAHGLAEIAGLLREILTALRDRDR